MVKRSDKLAFVSSFLDEENTYRRLTGFTDFSINLNPKEYTRKYVDEEIERSGVYAYAPTISYKFDHEEGNQSQLPFVVVSEQELMDLDTVCSIAIVDLAKKDNGKYYTEIREFFIVPDSEGSDPDLYTYSGTLRAATKKRFMYIDLGDDLYNINIVE